MSLPIKVIDRDVLIYNLAACVGHRKAHRRATLITNAIDARVFLVRVRRALCLVLGRHMPHGRLRLIKQLVALLRAVH